MLQHPEKFLMFLVLWDSDTEDGDLSWDCQEKKKGEGERQKRKHLLLEIKPEIQYQVEKLFPSWDQLLELTQSTENFISEEENQITPVLLFHLYLLPWWKAISELAVLSGWSFTTSKTAWTSQNNAG